MTKQITTFGKILYASVKFSPHAINLSCREMKSVNIIHTSSVSLEKTPIQPNYLALFCYSQAMQGSHSNIHHFVSFQPLHYLRFTNVRVIAMPKAKVISFTPAK